METINKPLTLLSTSTLPSLFMTTRLCLQPHNELYSEGKTFHPSCCAHWRGDYFQFAKLVILCLANRNGKKRFTTPLLLTFETFFCDPKSRARNINLNAALQGYDASIYPVSWQNTLRHDAFCLFPPSVFLLTSTAKCCSPWEKTLVRLN